MLRTWLSLLALVATAALLLACARGEPVDLLVTGGTVVTMDADRRVIEDGAVAVRGERIVAVGPAGELNRRYRARHRLQADGRLVLPGLINAHTHAAMSLYRGVADDLTLEEWLQDYIFPLEAKLTTPESVYWGTKLAALEMIRGGITTFVDMYYFEDKVAEASAEAGLRVVAGETILDFSSPDFKTPTEALRWTEEFITRWHGHPLVIPAVAPHSAVTCSRETLQAAAELARRTGALLLIHL
ncbi:MAG: amidohydrolase family protein, partial [Candidatus Acidiferrales bacterium]